MPLEISGILYWNGDFLKFLHTGLIVKKQLLHLEILEVINSFYYAMTKKTNWFDMDLFFTNTKIGNNLTYVHEM